MPDRRQFKQRLTHTVHSDTVDKENRLKIPVSRTNRDRRIRVGARVVVKLSTKTPMHICASTTFPRNRNINSLTFSTTFFSLLYSEMVRKLL